MFVEKHQRRLAETLCLFYRNLGSLPKSHITRPRTS